MAKIGTELEQQLKVRPDQPVDLIVRTRGDVTPYLAWLRAAGVQVKRQFKLSPGVAVSCRGAEALNLLDQDWVESVELDGPVRAIGG